MKEIDNIVMQGCFGEDNASPTPAIEPLKYILAVIAMEGRDVASFDLPGQFLQTDMDELLHLKINGVLALLLVEYNKRWKNFFQKERGRPSGKKRKSRKKRSLQGIRQDITTTNESRRRQLHQGKLENMFAAIRAIIPTRGEDWDDVADLHAKKYPGRDAESIRNKYNRLNWKMPPTGNPNMRWDIKQAKEIKKLIGDKAWIFTSPAAAAAAAATTQPVPLLLGQPTQQEEVTQMEEVTELTPASTASTISSSKKRHYNRKANNEADFMKVIATVLKEGREDRKPQQQALELHQQSQDRADEERKQALELQQQRQERADEERKVLLQALLAQLTTSGGIPSGGGPSGSPSGAAAGHAAVSPITPHAKKLKRKVNSLHQHPNDSSSNDDEDSDSSSHDNLLVGIN
eukprot:jgi/Psemu1/22536/gm1.22536_g